MPDLFDRLLLLKQSPVFSLVPTDDLRQVASALEEQHFFSGERIFEINAHGDNLYILVSGRVGISIEPDPASYNFIATLGPGDCFGEMNLLDDKPRSATAHAIEDTVVLSLDKSRLRGLILSYPEISIGMLRSLSLRLREANLRVTAIGSGTK
ncbi:MAG: cyclic nucleotide-binding domain-containing protein [Gammaproteobacteria bacterium]|jgi:CRP-like cAMP-binding protein